MPEPLHAILYRSIASRRFTPGELMELVEQAQVQNAAREVTGILLHGSMSALPQIPGSFVQWIEGPEDTVRGLYQAVASDRRHGEIEVLADGSLASLGFRGRLFGPWGMAMKSLSELPASLDGFLSAYAEGRLGSATR